MTFRTGPDSSAEQWGIKTTDVDVSRAIARHVLRVETVRYAAFNRITPPYENELN